MEVLKKIHEARKLIKDENLVKAGHNSYGKYDYYTPEQVNMLVNKACNKLNLLNKFCLKRTELGLVAEIKVIDLDSGKSELFEIATEIPQITATNIAQQLGGAVTYSDRYLLMSIYDIKDNNLDFDEKKPKDNNKEGNKEEDKKEQDHGNDNKPWLSESDKNKFLDKIRKGEYDKKEFFDKLYKTYKVKKDYTNELKSEFEK